MISSILCKRNNKTLCALAPLREKNRAMLSRHSPTDGMMLKYLNPSARIPFVQPFDIETLTLPSSCRTSCGHPISLLISFGRTPHPYDNTKNGSPP